MFIASLFIIAESGSKLSVHQQMDKQYVVYIFTGVLSALNRKKILHMKTMLSEIMQPLKKKKKASALHLNESKQTEKEPERRMVGARHWGNGRMASCLVSAVFCFCKAEKFWRLVAQREFT